MFFEFLIYIGVVNLIVGYAWSFPALAIELLLSKFNYIFSHAVQRLTGIALMSMITVYIANAFSESLVIFIIYSILGLLLNLYSLLQGIGESSKRGDDFYMDFSTKIQIEEKTDFDLSYSVLFYPVAFIIFFIFPFLTLNPITENLIYFVDFIINIPYIGWLIAGIGGISGIIFIPYSLFMIWVSFIISKDNNSSKVKKSSSEVESEIKEEIIEIEPETEIEPKSFSDDELDKLELLEVKIKKIETYLIEWVLNNDTEIINHIKKYNVKLTEYFNILKEELSVDNLDYISFYDYEDYTQFKKIEDMYKHRREEIIKSRVRFIEIYCRRFGEQIERFCISMFHDDWEGEEIFKFKNKENPSNERDEIRLIIDETYKRYKSKIAEYNGSFPSIEFFYINEDELEDELEEEEEVETPEMERERHKRKSEFNLSKIKNIDEKLKNIIPYYRRTFESPEERHSFFHKDFDEDWRGSFNNHISDFQIITWPISKMVTVDNKVTFEEIALYIKKTDFDIFKKDRLNFNGPVYTKEVLMYSKDYTNDIVWGYYESSKAEGILSQAKKQYSSGSKRDAEVPYFVA